MVQLSTALLVSAALLAQVWARECVKIQYDFRPSYHGVPEKADAIKQEYERAWSEYYQYAFPDDDLKPISKQGENDLFGWGASVVDGIDTAVVMGLQDIVRKQLKHIANTDFSKPDSVVDEFDAMIRYIGGLLSAYDIINSPLVRAGTYDERDVQALLDAAKTISDHLKPMFNSPSGLPYSNINFTTEQYSNCNPIEPCSNTGVDTAVTGTIILEWYRLSDLTRDNSYRDLAARAEANLISPKQMLVYPNIVGSSLDINTGLYTNINGGWQAGIDSFYEYLIKTYVYDPSALDTSKYKEFWVGAVDSTIKYLAKHPFGHPELTFISQLDGNGKPEYTMDDYACFAGGNYLLGGRYLNDQRIFDLGVAVTDSCHALFNSSEAGLNPSSWSWFNSQNKTYNPSDATATNVAYADKAGFYVDNAFWGSYPEPIESMWYAWRTTGDTRWQDYVWEAFQALIKDTVREGASTAELSDTTKPLGGSLVNYVPSFFFAEVMKYMYLTFSNPNVISLDEYVFNTEGHPLKIQTSSCATSGNRRSRGWPGHHK